MNKRQKKKKLMKSSPYIVAKKIKPKEIMLCTFAMNDEAYDARDVKGNILYKFAGSNEIHNVTKDVCPNCAKKIIGLLQLVPRVTFEEDNNIETMSIRW